MKTISVLLLFITVAVRFTASQKSPSVRTPEGRFIGYYKVSYHGRKYETYEGIPYSLPPIAKLRFQPPIATSGYFGTKNVTKLRKVCTQYDPIKTNGVIGAEDCLYLNIYKPPVKGFKLLPVLFWIHGGMFETGTGENYLAKYIADRDLIFVNFNYRVGPLGFLSTGDDAVPGNMGLKDQALALRWVSKNIRHFGGDPRRITIGGISVGAASVQYHYLSHATRGLFQNGMSFSTTALSPYVFSRRPVEVAKNFASALNCPTASSWDMLECLLNVPAEKLYLTQYHSILFKTYPFWFPYSLFGPVAENTTKGYFINKEPKEILKSGDVYDVPWFTSCTKDEGLFIVSAFVVNETRMNWVDKNWDHFAPYLFYYNNTFSNNQRKGLPQKIRRHYFGNDKITTKEPHRSALIQAASEAGVIIHSERAARLQAKATRSPVYFSYYTYRANDSVSYYLSNTKINLGVSHDDDIFLILENPHINPTKTASDRAMLEEMLDNWYSIVSTRKPNLGTKWLPVEPDSEEFIYMHIKGPKNSTLESSRDFAHKSFWKSLNFFV